MQIFFNKLEYKMKKIILITVLILNSLLTHSKEWVIKIPISKIRIFSTKGLKKPSWFITNHGVKNFINLSFFDNSFIPPFKDDSVFKPNNPKVWPFFSIDLPKIYSVPTLNPNIFFYDGHGIPAIWSKYIVSGIPLLLKNNNEQSISKNRFTIAMRPRTVIGKYSMDTLLIFITDKMRVIDLPKKMKSLGCSDALNLDGGGSTILYENGGYIYKQKNIRSYPNILSW